MIDYSLYLCTDCEINKNYEIEECVKQAIQGGVTFVQVRVKNKSFTDFLEIAQRIKKITDYYHIPLIINDNIDIALKINADGIHIGQDDMSCTEARKILGKDKIIGVSVTSLEEAQKAITDGATYLGVGAIYKSHTKKDAKVVGEDELKKIAEFSSIPVIVIGGINEHTIPKLNGIKIDGYAMIRPIIGQNNIMGSTKKLKKIISMNKYK